MPDAHHPNNFVIIVRERDVCLPAPSAPVCSCVCLHACVCVCVQSESIDLRPSVAAACREERGAHCARVPPGSGATLNCLLGMAVVHAHDFSPACLEVLDTLQEHRMLDLRTGGPAAALRRCLRRRRRLRERGQGGRCCRGLLWLRACAGACGWHRCLERQLAARAGLGGLPCSTWVAGLGWPHVTSHPCSPLPPSSPPPADFQLRRACEADIASACSAASATSDQLDGGVLRCLVGSVGQLTSACAAEVSRGLMMGLNYYKQVSRLPPCLPRPATASGHACCLAW